MKPVTKITVAFLGVALVVIALMVGREALGGTTFRAAEYDTFADCVANIPREWLQGSLERGRAEAACAHEEHERRRQQPAPR
jgi:hypothetical protein